jgi:hypothetical protein
MIETCWHANRDRRKTALQCYVALNHYQKRNINSFDVFISFESSHEAVATTIFHQFSRMNLDVYFQPSDNPDNKIQKDTDTDFLKDRENDITDKIAASKTIVACVSRKYQESAVCMNQLKKARNHITKPIVALFMEEKNEEWRSQELMYYCQLLSSLTIKCDLGDIANLSCWESQDGVDAETLKKLDIAIEPVIKQLSNFAARPSDYIGPFNRFSSFHQR